MYYHNMVHTSAIFLLYYNSVPFIGGLNILIGTISIHCRHLIKAIAIFVFYCNYFWGGIIPDSRVK